MGAAGRRGLLMTGAAVSDWSPLDLSGGHHWLDGSDLTTMWQEDAKTNQSAAGTPVAIWEDKIAGIDWHHTSGASRWPDVAGDSVGVDFDGSELLGRPYTDLDWMRGAGVNHRTFVVFKIRSSSNQSLFAAQYAYPGNNFYVSATSNVLTFVAGNGSNNHATHNGAVCSLNTVSLAESHFDNDNNRIGNALNNANRVYTNHSFGDLGRHVNDTVHFIGGDGTNFDITILMMDGIIYDLVCVDDITVGEFASLMTYFNAKYGLSLPTTE